MFFKNGERLIFRGEDIHKDYKRYNQIAREIYTSKIGEFSVNDVYKKSESQSNAHPKKLELSLWRVTDKNANAKERGIDTSEFVIEKPGGEIVSYVVVPRMNTDTKDKRPCEYTEEKADTFEDINDPRVSVIARSYKGVVAEIAKDLVLENEKEVRENYKILADQKKDVYIDFSNKMLIDALIKQAVRTYEPNVYASFIENKQQIKSNYSKNPRYETDMLFNSLQNFAMQENYEDNFGYSESLFKSEQEENLEFQDEIKEYNENFEQKVYEKNLEQVENPNINFLTKQTVDKFPEKFNVDIRNYFDMNVNEVENFAQ